MSAQPELPEDQPPRSPAPAEQYRPNAAHLIRTAQVIHVQLSAMADQKASILMAATFVIFTITIGQAQGEAVPLPILILGASAFFSAVCAVLSVLPATDYRWPGGLNLLFFGSFARLEEEDYVERLTAELKNDDAMYRMVARDIFQNGSVLARKKYRLLGIAYRIFLAGLIASAISFVVTYASYRG